MIIATSTVRCNYNVFNSYNIRWKYCLTVIQAFAARRIFELTDKDENGMIDQTEMFAVTSLLATGDTREKLKFLFAMYDENGKCCKGGLVRSKDE